MRKVIISLFAILAIMLSSCGYSSEDVANARSQGYKSGYNEGRAEGYDAGYKEGYADGQSAPKPVARPVSGTILVGREYDGSILTVTADSTSNYVVSLKDSEHRTYLSFFVRAGETVTVGVPSKYLYVYFASGKTWYGYGQSLMFGENTVYSKDDEIKDFTTYEYTYTLYPVSDGNFEETPSNANEFF